MLISKYIILIFSLRYLFYVGFFSLSQKRKIQLRRAYTVATPLPAVQHRQYIRCIRIQTYREYIYMHMRASIWLRRSENETYISARSAPARVRGYPSLAFLLRMENCFI